MLGDSVRRRQPARRQRQPNPKPRKIPWRIVLPSVLAALVIPFGIGYAVAVNVLFPPPEASGSGIAVPALVGQSVDEANRLLATAGLGRVDTTSITHPNAPRGEILAQDPLPGQQLRSGANVRVSVSAGPPRVVVPDVEGFGGDAAEQLLRRVGFDTRRVEESAFAAPGRVLRLEPAPGSRQELPATITIVVSAGYGVQQDTAPAYVPPDTIIE
ncbi:MAG TPA: PASTA domain-containing protein [Longimicrobiales bacterium]